MNRYQCPACGAPRYFGGRCAQCFYKPFFEEVAHGNHTHLGEPLILRQGSAPQDPQCPQFSGPRKPRIPKGLTIGLIVAGFVVLFFFSPALSVLGASGLLVRNKYKRKQ